MISDGFLRTSDPPGLERTRNLVNDTQNDKMRYIQRVHIYIMYLGSKSRYSTIVNLRYR